MPAIHSDRAIDVPRPYETPGKYPTVVRSSRYITLSDGVRVAIDLYLPQPLEQGAKIPTILLQTRYWRATRLHPDAAAAMDADDPLAGEKMSQYKRLFLAHGYAWVDLDVRGTGASFGFRAAEFSDQEVRDGAEVVDWIVQQPWSSGKVGALGISYEGTTAELLLANGHPAVKAAAPMFALYDAYADVAYPGGIRSDWFLDTWSGINESLDRNEQPDPPQETVLGVRPVDEDEDGSLLAAALKDHRQNTTVTRQLEGILFRDDPSASGAVDSIDAISPSTKQESTAASGAAIYSISGWFDGAYPHSAVKRFLTLPNPGSKLLIGPWNHGGFTNISPLSRGPAEFDLPAELLKFFEFHLKDIDTGIAREKPVHYFTMGAEQWHAADSWPPQSEQHRFYLALGGWLKTGANGSSSSLTYRVDLQAGTGEAARWNSLIGMPLDDPYPGRAAQDERLLCFDTPPLAQDCEVTGHPLLELYIASDRPILDVFAYLEDVDPHGGVVCVTEGLLRAAHRELAPGPPPYISPAPYRSYLRADARPVPPGEVLHLVFDLLPLSYRFTTSHSIRLALSGADKDHFNPVGTEPPVWRVYFGPKHPSQLILPVVN